MNGEARSSALPRAWAVARLRLTRQGSRRLRVVIPLPPAQASDVPGMGEDRREHCSSSLAWLAADHGVAAGWTRYDEDTGVHLGVAAGRGESEARAAADVVVWTAIVHQLVTVCRDESCPRCGFGETGAAVDFSSDPRGADLLYCRGCGWVDAAPDVVLLTAVAS